MDPFWSHVLEELIANLILAVGLIFINEIIIPKRNISGEWGVDLTYENTSYERYKGIKIQYKINLLQQNNSITGHGEKVSDIDAERGFYEFERSKRVHIEISGYYERNFIRKSIVYLHITEQGRSRDTSQSFVLFFDSKNKLSGKFTTTAADASGPITIVKNDLNL